ncbi:16S rRNA (adenine(1518)-N(6)/adenine(1519)-N(6))-dimethyltransferase RsmA [Nisaea sp.]|uniref:16S rRNA (adenine(1518)-N(6)/adenine(1519)-N(6))- dimethyltransferase RsmA n=1 Tax=Nisaea sp. TaxID=2024842 RepID=UPI003B51FE88
MTDQVIQAIEALPPLRDVIARYQLSAKKSLGQNFLFDLNLTRRIARSAGKLGTGTCIEIGPGPGGLTRALLLEGACKVIAVERDRRAIEALQDLVEASGGRLEIIEADALDIELASLGDAPRRVVANLPYNVGTPMLLSWLKHAEAFESFTLMFQKEVAERIAASPGTEHYGRLSIAARWRAEIFPLFDIPPRAFTPAPKVTSQVIQLRPRTKPLAEADPDLLEKVTAAAFSQRRKMLRASLKSFGGGAFLDSVGIDPTARPETLSVEQFCALARAIERKT